MYVKIVYKLIIKNNVKFETDLDEMFKKYVQEFTFLNAKSTNLKDSKNKEKNAAYERLYKLIKDGFKMDQCGRYFKRWSSLSNEKKNERISSYCTWFARTNNLSITSKNEMYSFIIDKIEKKELRTTDIVWNSKMGIIVSINVNFGKKESENITTVDDDNNDPSCFQIGERKIVKKRKSSLKKNLTPLSTKMAQRIHRLILFEILKRGSHDKNTIIQEILVNLYSRNLGEKQPIYRYIASKYDEMIQIISNNPM